MKVLVAAVGTRADDFSRGVPGELVMLGEVCFRDEHGDGDCGCGRAFTGVASGAPTTLAVVSEVEHDLNTLAAAVKDSMTGAGWDCDNDLALEVAEEIVNEAEPWPTGTRLRRNIDEIEVE